jgi:hypothetical protein
VVLFLLAFTLVSRLTLSDYNPIGEHVATTQGLLNDIGDVEKAANPRNGSIVSSDQDLLKINYNELKITDISVVGVNENKSIVSFFVEGEVSSEGDEFYYVKIKDFSSLEKGDLLFMSDSGNEKLADFISWEEEEGIVNVRTREENKFTPLLERDILGLIFLIRQS